jgi:hypothetical protein
VALVVVSRGMYSSTIFVLPQRTRKEFHLGDRGVDFCKLYHECINLW